MPTAPCGPVPLVQRRLGPPGTYTVPAAPDKVSGATKDMVIYSTPLEFTKANYLKYNF